MSRFAELEAMVSDAVDDLYGETVRIEPRAGGEYVAAGEDPDRQPFNRAAVVDFKPTVVRTRYAGRNDADVPDLSGDLVHVSIAEPGLPYVPRQGDLVVATTRTPPVAFSIAVVEPDGLGRIILRCKPAVVPS